MNWVIKNGISLLYEFYLKKLFQNIRFHGYEVTADFTLLGKRTMSINAQEVIYKNGRRKMLLSIFDITNQRDLESEKENLVQQKDLLLKEMRHRIANSLQLIASILLIKADIVKSKETKAHLEDVHERIMSVATVQRQLNAGGLGEQVLIGPYLRSLCKSLARSMIGNRKPITLSVKAKKAIVSPEAAISLGLITAELVINSIKHAFPANKTGKVLVTYEVTNSGWVLCVTDNGVGRKQYSEQERSGLGTSIVKALANQLSAYIKTESSSRGTSVSFIHAENG